jgi:hypothetical protein
VTDSNPRIASTFAHLRPSPSLTRARCLSETGERRVVVCGESEGEWIDVPAWMDVDVRAEEVR